MPTATAAKPAAAKTKPAVVAQAAAKTAAAPLAPRPMKRDVLDRSKHYSTVHGPGSDVAFQQDGRQYDVRGERIYAPGEQRTSPAPTRESTSRPALQPQNDNDGGAEDDDLIREETEIEDGVNHVSRETAGDVAVGDVNLTAWGMGEVNYLFGKVRAAIMERYAKDVISEDDAMDFLKEEKVIPGDAKRSAT